MAPKAKQAPRESPRKRQKTSAPAVVPRASTEENSTAPAMSAKAARNATAAAAKSDTSDTDTDEDSEHEQEAIPSDDELKALEESSASSAEDDQPRKTPKLKKKSLSAGRYFAGEDSSSARNRPRSVAGAPEPLREIETFDNDDGEAIGDAQEQELEEQKLPSQGKLGRGKRQRREKSAFLDPFCYSRFTPDSLNAVWVDWKTRENETKRGLVLALDSEETIVIHGSYRIMSVFGSVAVLGATLSSYPTCAKDGSFEFDPTASSSHAVFAPSSHPLPIVVSEQLPFFVSTPESLGYPTTMRLPNGDDLDLSSASSVILIEDLGSGIEGVETVLRCGGLGGGNGMWETAAPTSANLGGAGWRLVLEPAPSLTSVRSPGSWTRALSDFAPLDPINEPVASSSSDSERIVCMVEGPKRVGKSTFAKLLLNRLLSKYEHVAYLDTDLGQPEFTPPGLVSLNVVDRPVFGPSFTHLSLPVASHFLGSTSPASDPAAYLAAVNALFATYSTEIEYPLLDEEPSVLNGRPLNGKIKDRIPLVVNTQGWIKGLGGDLLEKIKAVLRPTHLFRFETPVEEGREGWNEDSQPMGGEGDAERVVYRLDVSESSPLDSKWSAADLRTLGFISYFHSRFPTTTLRRSAIPTNSFSLEWDFSQALVERTPWELDWSDRSKLSEVHFLAGEIDSTQVLHALNGAIIGIVTSSIPSHETTSGFPYSIDSPFPDPSTSNCHSLALVRSVSPSSKLFYILLPASPATITTSDAAVEEAKGIRLVKGELELPVCLMLDFNASSIAVSVEETAMPYLSVEDGVGRKKVRRNLMRRGQN